MNLILTDVQLMERVRAGDTEAFRAIAERYHNRIASYFVGCGLPPDVVDDLTQSTLLRALQHGRRYSIREWSDRTVEALLFLVARSVKRDRARREISRGEMHDEYSRVAPTEARAADAEMESEESVRVVRAALELLPPMHRLLVKLRYLEERSLADVAQRTGMSSYNVKRYLGSARAKLHDLLEPWWKGVRHDQL